MDELQAEYVENTIEMLDNDEPEGMEEAMYILEYASSDDCKNRLADEIHALSCAMETYQKRNIECLA